MDDLELDFQKSEKRGPLRIYKNQQSYFRQGMRPQGDRIRPGAVDRAVYLDEHGLQERSEERIRDQLLQIDERLGVRKNDGKPEKPR